MTKLLIGICLFSFQILAAQNKTSVITQHNDHYRTGWNDKEIVLKPANVAGPSFGLIGSIPVDDQVYAQPLVIKNITINNFNGSVVFVATVNNTVYAFNADDPTNSAALWQVNLNPAGQRTPNISDLRDSVYFRPCGGVYRDFTRNIGIVGTPVIDTISNTLYIANKSIDSSGNFSLYINALDITTGMHRPGSPRKMQASVNGTGDGNINGVVNFDAKYANQRPALLLHNNTVYLATSSYCDWGPYHGWVLGYDAATLDLKYTYNATPNGWAGGIWMAGQGISVGDDGNLYLVTGNGTTGGDNNDFSGGRSESLIKLTPQLQMLDWYTPTNYEYLDIEDLDYGSDGVLLIPNSPLTVSGSKEGISYVIDYNNLGRLTPGNVQVKDTLVFNPTNLSYIHVHGSPAYAKQGADEYVYGWSESYKIRQFKLDRNTNTFFNNFKEGSRVLDYGMPGAMLSVSSNGTDTSTGIVWACFPTTGNANHEVRPGTLTAYRASDVGAGEIWNSDQHITDTVGKFAKFNCPTIANGKVYVPTFSNELRVYGIKCASAADTFTYGNGIGLKGQYYTNNTSASFDSDIPVVTRIDKKIAFNWGSGSPDSTVSNNAFKVRWTGKLRPLSNDTYTFYVTAGDGVRLYINNQLLIDSWNDKTTTVDSAQITLQKKY